MLGDVTPPADWSVATRFVVLADPALINEKFMVTVSPGSTAWLVQLSTARTRLLDTICGEAGPASALIKPLPEGVPQPVHRSYPEAAKNFAGLLLFVLLPVMMS